MTSTSRVSVVIAVWNAERYVAEAIASVLDQGTRALEVVVVDDGSTDRSLDVVRRVADTRCRVVPQTHLGAAAARNVGVASSTGSLLGFLDADDVWAGGKLELQIDALSRDPALDMVFGHYVSFGEGIVSPTEPQPGYSLGTLLIRRERFLTVGPLSTEWRVGEFIDWYARAGDAGLRHAMLPDVLLRRRVHDSNLTATPGARADYARVIRAVAARRARGQVESR